MAAGVHPIRGLSEPTLSTADQTGAGMEREALGRMMFTESQENVVFALQLATAVYHSRIAGVDTEVVLQTVVAKGGARSLLTLGRTNCGGTAGVEQDPNL